ncbi:MAG: LysM peptidoglycan-binding domain-containing protein [Clostridia bacterium]|nr:LysM peptidoglycan-binding domain-containing protein [Clostridia bacterium]
MKRTYKRTSYREKARRQRRTLLIMVMAMIMAFGLGVFAVADDGIDFVTVTVSSGDTLWNLCAPYKPERMDLRDFIEKVKYENNMESSEIFMGQELMIPVR